MPVDVAVPSLLVTATANPLPRFGGRRTKVATATIILLTFVLGFWPSFEKAAAPMDEGTLLVYPELIQHGQVPYRDFETFYGPANPYVLAAAYSVFGTSIFVERSVGLVYRVLILLAIFGLTQKWGTLPAAACTLIAGVLLLMSQLAAYAWLGGVACGLCALWALADFERTWRVFVGGLLAGAALLYRPDLMPAMLLAAAPLLWAMPRRARLAACAGGASAMIPFAILMIFVGPAELLNNLFIYPVLYSNPGRRLPLLSAAPLVLRVFSAYLLAAVANVAAGVMALQRARADRRALLFLGLSLFALALVPQAMQRLDLIHLVFVAFLSLGLLPLSFLILANRSEETRRNFAASVAFSTLAVAVVIGVIAPKVWLNAGGAVAAAIDPSMNSAVFLEQNGRSFPFPSPQAAAVTGKLFEKLDRLSKPGERLFVGPADLRRTNSCDTFIYHLFPRLQPATYFLEMNPFSANRGGSRLAADVESADWLVLDMAWDTWREQNASGVNGPDAPNQAVRTHFNLIGQYGPFVLLKHNP